MVRLDVLVNRVRVSGEGLHCDGGLRGVEPWDEEGGMALQVRIRSGVCMVWYVRVSSCGGGHDTVPFLYNTEDRCMLAAPPTTKHERRGRAHGKVMVHKLLGGAQEEAGRSNSGGFNTPIEKSRQLAELRRRRLLRL